LRVVSFRINDRERINQDSTNSAVFFAGSLLNQTIAVASWPPGPDPESAKDI
jgi:hypothetical protein